MEATKASSRQARPNWLLNEVARMKEELSSITEEQVGRRRIGAVKRGRIASDKPMKLADFRELFRPFFCVDSEQLTKRPAADEGKRPTSLAEEVEALANQLSEQPAPPNSSQYMFERIDKTDGTTVLRWTIGGLGARKALSGSGSSEPTTAAANNSGSSSASMEPAIRGGERTNSLDDEDAKEEEGATGGKSKRNYGVYELTLNLEKTEKGLADLVARLDTLRVLVSRFIDLDSFRKDVKDVLNSVQELREAVNSAVKARTPRNCSPRSLVLVRLTQPPSAPSDSNVSLNNGDSNGALLLTSEEERVPEEAPAVLEEGELPQRHDKSSQTSPQMEKWDGPVAGVEEERRPPTLSTTSAAKSEKPANGRPKAEAKLAAAAAPAETKSAKRSSATVPPSKAPSSAVPRPSKKAESKSKDAGASLRPTFAIRRDRRPAPKKLVGESTQEEESAKAKRLPAAKKKSRCRIC